MKNLPPAAIAVAAILILGGCQSMAERHAMHHGGISDADAAAVAQLADDWQAVYNAHDWDGFRPLLSDNFAAMPQDAPLIVGVDDYVAFYEQGPPGAIEITTEEVDGRRGLAYATGTYSVDLPMEDGATVNQVGKWLIVATKQRGGAWKLHRQIWNSDAP